MPALPGGAGQLSTVMLLIIAIVGTTVAPWQLFFQQSYVIDKRITPRFMQLREGRPVDRHRRRDRRRGGDHGVHRRGVRRHARSFGHFTDAAGLARAACRNRPGIRRRPVRDRAARRLDHRRVRGLAVHRLRGRRRLRRQALAAPRASSGAKGFYAVYAGLVALAAAVVLIPGSPLGLLTEGVQTLAGVLLPSASVFLLLLCNDKEVLGPWVNGRKTNLFTATVVAVLVVLSVILTASVLFPAITAGTDPGITVCCAAARPRGRGYALTRRRARAHRRSAPVDRAGREEWRMPPLALLSRPSISAGRKIGMSALRLYLAVAMILVIIKIVQLAIGH